MYMNFIDFYKTHVTFIDLVIWKKQWEIFVLKRGEKSSLICVHAHENNKIYIFCVPCTCTKNLFILYTKKKLYSTQFQKAQLPKLYVSKMCLCIEDMLDRIRANGWIIQGEAGRTWILCLVVRNYSFTPSKPTTKSNLKKLTKLN